MDDNPKDPGVKRESTDPSGQYRLAATGMLGFERIGRIPVPYRILYPWLKEAEEPKAKKLEEFKHEESKPFYRQLELADRVAYDLKNSYFRLDESKEEFYVPEEQDLEGKLKDIYDPGFTESKTVKLEKYDKRRSGMWQGEDGSIIIRDAWGSEIVMIGGNIQLACAGNVEILPGKSALTLAGDDIIHKAQNSVDIESADKDVRLNGFKNVQIMAGCNDEHPGGITLEAKGRAYPWDGKTPEGGEDVQSVGILLKSHDGAVVTDAYNTIIRSGGQLSLLAGEEKIDGGEGFISIAADIVDIYGKSITETTEKSTLLLDSTVILTGETVIAAAETSTAIMQGKEFLVPLAWVPGKKNIAQEINSGLQGKISAMKNDEFVSEGYTPERLEKMIFKFRSSQQCDTLKSWEIDGPEDFTLYEPFWVQVKPKFETLKKIQHKDFDDHIDEWDDDTKNPWPGTEALAKAKYAELEKMTPINMDDDGFNKPRKEVKDKSPVIELPLFPTYQIREED
jgi:hypothetical protein